MKNYIIASLLVVIAYMGFKLNTLRVDYNDLYVEIKAKNDEVEKQVNIAYQDCQKFMNMDRRVQRINGCYATIELLCSETDKPLTCMDKFLKTCNEIGD